MVIESLKGTHPDETIWVLGSGPSLRYIEPDFFEGKLTIGVNLVSSTYGRTTYSITKYHDVAEALIAHYGTSNPRTFVSQYLHGNHSKEAWDLQRPDCWVFEHNDNPGETLSVSDWPPDGHLLASHSTIGSAIHLAAHLGAKYCVLVGHDCGLIDSDQHLVDYPTAASDALWRQYPSFEAQTRFIKQEVLARYGMSLHSLNPFVSPNLEGHSYFSRANRINLPWWKSVAITARSALAAAEPVRAGRRTAVRVRNRVRRSTGHSHSARSTR